MSDPRPGWIYDPSEQNEKDTPEKMSIDSITRKAPKSPAQIEFEMLGDFAKEINKALGL